MQREGSGIIGRLCSALCARCAGLCARLFMPEGHQERWLSYRELGAILGCTANAARMHAVRRGWARRAPNRIGDCARVLVPTDVVVQPRMTHDAAQFVTQP